MTTQSAETPTVQKTTAVKATRAAGEARKFSKLMTSRAQQYKAEGKPVAWVMYARLHGPILKAFDIASCYTENYAGVCSAKKQDGKFITHAEEAGFANEICGYVRIGLGYAAMRKEGLALADSPDGGMPEPDLLIGCSSGCDPRYKWYEATGRYNDAPHFSYDDVITQPNLRTDDRLSAEYLVRYQTEQLHRLVQFLEQRLGRKMDWDHLREVFRLHNETHKLYSEAFQLRKATPAPMPTQDAFALFVPHMFLPAEQATYEFYKNLRDELKERVENGIGVIQNEKYRLLWAYGIPPWHSMNIFNYFQDHGAVFPIEIPYNPFEPYDEFPVGSTDPIEQFVRWNFEKTMAHVRRSRELGDVQAQRAKDYVEQYKIDGLVSHGVKSCRVTTVGAIHLRRVLDEQVKLPSLYIQSDIVDSREYSEAQTHLRIDAFLEAVEANKRRLGA